MEGGVQAVVAIIQGLEDCGLAVTLLSEKRLRDCQAQKPAKVIVKSSVETSTESPKRTVKSQISDDQYASTYQVAHCRFNPTSPSPNLPEFPLQRRTPSRSSFHYSPSRSSPSDSFVESLRKYPLPLEKDVSSELVQRLINYTQAKNSSCENSHSMRSLATRSSKLKRHIAKKQLKKEASKANKNIQTYTRIVNETPLVKEQPKKRDKEISPKTDQLSETYNYLRAPVSGRRSYTGYKEVRYLNDIKQCIQKTMREVLMNRTPVYCRNIQSRYDEHRRLHHRRDSATSPVTNEYEINAEISKDGSTVTDNKKSDFCLGTTSSLVICPKTLSRYRMHRHLHHGELNEIELHDTDEAKTPGYCRPPLRINRVRPSRAPHHISLPNNLHPRNTSDQLIYHLQSHLENSGPDPAVLFKNV